MNRSSRLGALAAVLAILGMGCSAVAGPASQPTAASLPGNPCDVLTVEQVSAAAGVTITERRRVPSIDEIVRAQREGRDAGPGPICSYETRSDYGAIEFSLASAAEAARYREARGAYFRDFPGSAKAVPGIGDDAWIGGGTSLRVLAREGVAFTVSTQMYQPGSRDLLVRVASEALGSIRA